MTRKQFALVALISSGLAVLAGILAAKRPWTSSVPVVAARLAEASVLNVEGCEFGEVEESSAARIAVRPRNSGTEPILVTRCSVACCGSVVATASATIPAGGAVAFAITLDLTPQHPSEYGRLIRPIDVQLAAETTAQRRAFKWHLTGTCRAALAVSAPILHFGEANAFGREPVSRSLTVLLADPGSTIAVVPESPTIRVVGIERRPDRAIVRFAPDTAVVSGPFSTKVRIEAVASDGRRLGQATVEVNGQVRRMGE